MTPWRHVAGLQISQNYQILAFIGLLILPFALPKHTDEPYIVEPTPALRIGDEELTTVLLVSNENRTASHGRYVNVRPDVGLLTSTARTFIQEGITTEYATQVLGTTLENGRIYAQLLKKSSRVLFDKESSIAPSNIGGVVHTSIIGEAPFQNYPQPKSLLQSHNDLVADKDWQDIDDRILFEKNSFVGNTDFVGNIPKPSFVVFPVKASADRELAEKSSETFSKPENTATNSNKTAKIMADKVQPHIDLPTYTVKNMFSPSGFAWESDLDRQTDDDIEPLSLKNKSLFAVQRSPKLLYQKKNMKNAADSSRTLSTVTYYGFADFTTVVGDSVIVFSPSTSSAERNPMAQVTSITGKATLGPQEPSYVVKVPISITQDLIEPTFVNPMLSTNIDDLRVLPTDMREKNKDQGVLLEETSANDQETSEELEEKTTLAPNNDDSPTTLDEDPEEPTTTAYLDDKNQFEPVVLVSSMVSSMASSIESAIQTPTETETSRVMLSRPSDEEILKIYSSLARAEAEKSSSSSTKEDLTQSSSATSSTRTVEEATTSSTTPVEEDLIQPDIKVEGGATTVFFEDDPFVDFIDATESSRTLATVTQQLETITEAMQIDEEEQSTTEEEPETFPTTEETNEESTESIKEKDDEGQLKPIIKEIEEDEEVSNCLRTSQVYLTQIPKTVTFYTTFFIPDEENVAETATSVETNIVPSFDIKQATKHYCIQSTPYSSVGVVSAVLERPLSVADDKNSQMLLEEATTPMMIVRENAEVTESLETETTEAIDQDEDDDEEESEEEIELIYKTLYTTYTYLTTFFHDSTTSVSSHKEIVTNVVTSSVSTPEVTPTRSLDFNQTNSQHDSTHESTHESTHDDDSLHHSDLVQIDDILRETKPTEYLNDANVAKTYFTTYTYYTTIFVDGETEIMSRTEVHTNVVGKSDPSARNVQLDRDNAVIDLIPTATATYNTIERTAAISTDVASKSHAIHELESSSSSSSSRSERKIVPIVPSSEQLDNVDNAVLEDQISSESNTEEIVPFATLLLQTSYTTFTYYTTMYSNDATNVVSRLETITNVDTETLQPTKTLSLDEATLPITYFTTFTYWTKLEKDGEISTLKREETISNVVTPSISSDSSDSSDSSASISKTEEMSSSSSEEPSPSSNVPTTFYTTYTYFTTSYAGDKTVTDSRFETVTNLVTPSVSSLDVLESASIPSSSSSTETDNTVVSTPPLPPSTIEYDFKTIVDAEGISTLYSKTQVLETQVDGTLTTIASSSSTIKIDEVKKALSSTQEAASTKTYKTGLVRLISGTKFANRTTTVYQSKVIGTLIDQRYAQIIESTSSFIIEKTPVKSLELDITPTTASPVSVQTTALVLSAQTTEEMLESSINDAKDEETESDNDSEDEEQDENGRSRTRLSFQTKKKTFTPVIRPFVSRNRPQFAPKRKNVLQSSATIITRSDLTPTITATPALKSDSRGRFSSSRKSNAGSSSSSNVGNSSQAGKRFSRPSKSSQYGQYGSSSSYPGSSSRNRLQSSRGGGQLQTSSVGGFPNSRRNGVNSRGSSTNSRSFSSVYLGNSRLRIRPSTSLPYDSQSNTGGYTTLPAESAEEDDGGVTQRYESEEEQDLTTENVRRNNNNLLRFRRPQLPRPGFQAGGQRTLGQVTPRRIPSSQKPRTTTTTSTTTQRSRPRVSSRPVLFGQNRPQSSLFPPRRLFDKKTDEVPKSDIIEDSDGGKDDEESDYENDDEASEDEEQDILNRRRRQSSRSLVLSRSKRQTSNSFRNRFRRPTTAKVAVDERADDPIHEDESSTVRSRASTRFTPRSHSLPSSNKSTNRAAIRPTKPHASSNRAQFTLREKDTTPKNSTPRLSTNFRRLLHNGASSPSSSRRTTTTATSRSKTSRAKSYGNPITEPSHSSPRGRTPQTNGGRSRSSTSRSRSRNDFTPDPIVPPFNGTITVTHTTPTEITIPIVNGKVTEYKNVLTTTTSTEVVAPNQYTSILGQGGSSTLILNREETSINLNGATEITQFVLHETPTTTVIFTPTTIRGRKTSFAHMIPSTAYVVENVVSTMQPQIAANAPLANILLSQLLLGNLGSLNQQNINPLLALGAGAAATPVNLQNPGEPTTEYKTRSSTYVTTVGNGKSTIIPLTFHGKEILTTIYDSSSDVITATEYFTDTIVTTPTQQVQQVQQVNSLLLPYLLQQQQLQGLGQPQQQQQQLPQPVFPIQNTNPAQLLFPDNIQDLDHNGIQKYNDYGTDIEDYPNNTQDDQDGGQRSSSGSSRKKEPVINTNHHHQIQYRNTHNLNSKFDSQNEIPHTTQFLTFSKLRLRDDHKSKIRTRRSINSEFIENRPTDLDQSLDNKNERNDDKNDEKYDEIEAIDVEKEEEEDKSANGEKARYNLATRIMSNGVEVIIAGDKNSKSSNTLRLLPSLSRKPMTLAPSTLKDQMILVMPSNAEEKYTIPINSKHFITKTCLTTYTYRTTYLQDGKTTVKSREKVISNTATEQKNYLKIKPTETLGITLSQTPELAVGVFHTTYTYYNTILDGVHSVVVSSQHVLTNTITAPDDYISFLQPSEVATPVLETNTYYTRIALTKTLKEANSEKLVSTSNILTQVIITEFLQPAQTSSIRASYVALDLIDEKSTKQSEELELLMTKFHTLSDGESATAEGWPLTSELQFTTLGNAGYDGKIDSSTVIESIKGQVSTIDTNLKDHSSFGVSVDQPIDISTFSAVNKHPDIGSSSSSVQEPQLENSNLVPDSVVSSSENEDFYAAEAAVDSEITGQYPNSTKTADIPSTTNQLFDLNRFQALGPVINAMAGLIQKNLNHFGNNELRKNLSALNLEGKQVENGTKFDQSHGGPIYIPVQIMQGLENPYQNGAAKIRSQNFQVLHISPPTLTAGSLLNGGGDEKMPISGGFEPPLLNGGIPISPGEVITANSDVIVGKPSGIQPRVPYTNDVVEMLLPPPPSPKSGQTPYSYQFQFQQLVRTSPKPLPLSESSSSSMNFDGILKPPLMPYPMHPPNGFKSSPPYGSSKNSPPPHRMILPNLKKNIPFQWSKPPQNKHQGLYRPQIPNFIPYAPYDYDQQYPPSNNNKILEIKQIPQVYSTDLPASSLVPYESRLSPTSNSSRNNGIYKAFIKIVANPSDKQMLVDIQPSKIKNIVFPRDNSASVLVAESSVELHKSGQYYDEPTTYPDALMTGSVTIASSSPIKTVPLSNQQVNLDMNVLSHNVDMNAPPITFNKDSEFPALSSPVRGQIQKIPHVTIPTTDNQIQINLTPLSLSGHFVNDVETVFNTVQEPADKIETSETSYKTSVGAQRPSQQYSQTETDEFLQIFNKVAPQSPNSTHFYLKNNRKPSSSSGVNDGAQHRKRPSQQYSPEPDKIRTSETPYKTSAGAQHRERPSQQHSQEPDKIETSETSYKTSGAQNRQRPSQQYPQTEFLQIFDKVAPEQTQFHLKNNRKPSPSGGVNDNNLYHTFSSDGASFADEYTPKPSISHVKKTAVAPKDEESISTDDQKPSSSLIIDVVPSSGEKNNKHPSGMSKQKETLQPSSQNASKLFMTGRPFKAIAKVQPSSKKTTVIPKPVYHSGEGFKLQATTVKSQQTEAPFNPKYRQNAKRPQPTEFDYLNLNQMEVLAKPNQTTAPDRNKNHIELTDISNHHKPSLGSGQDEPVNKNPKYQHFSMSTDVRPPDVRSPDVRSPLNVIPVTEEVLGLNPPPLKPVQISPSLNSSKSTELKRNLFALMTTTRPTKRTTRTTTLTTTSASPFAPYTKSRPAVTSKPVSLQTFFRKPSYTYGGAAVQVGPGPHPTNNSSQLGFRNPSYIYGGATVQVGSGPQPTNTSSPLGPRIDPTKASSNVTSSSLKGSKPKLTVPTRVKPATTPSMFTPTTAPALSKLPSSGEKPYSNQEVSIEGSEMRSIASSASGKTPQAKTIKPQEPSSMTFKLDTARYNTNSVTSSVISSGTSLVTPSVTSSVSSSVTSSVTSLKSSKTKSLQIVPTKYITKLQYLTVTTTKLSISTSLGLPVTQTLTQTLTETQTSTFVDTVTETETQTHTRTLLQLQPTRVTDSQQTATVKSEHVIRYEDYQHLPEAGQIEPTIEIVNNVLFTSTDSEVVKMPPNTPKVTDLSNTPKVTDLSDTKPNVTTSFENNSIFVVMTDKNTQPGVFSIGPSLTAVHDSPGADNPSSIELDYDYNITFDLPTRDEEVENNELNHVVLGGVLIATPPKSNYKEYPSNGSVTAPVIPAMTCQPSCRASRNEICQLLDNRMQCHCRPGFARMFPDRPCKPTYTYALAIPIHRIGKHILHFDRKFESRDSNEFKQLANVTHNAVDRMVMQSDLRDVYHGVHVNSFNVATPADDDDDENGIVGNFLIQLSDSSDVERLVGVFKKYLRKKNFSLGGTDIFTTKNGINSLQVNDFDECSHSQFHDCSENSKCFNLQGTYTCVCQEGFADLSENSIYPGRICSADVMGCEKCYYHGKCTMQSNRTDMVMCECFSWYTGASCQINLKIVLIALITIGTILFILLLFCVLITCTQRQREHYGGGQSLMSGMQIIAPKHHGKHLTIDKRVITDKDTSSESSENSLPYILKRDVKKQTLVRKTNHQVAQHQNHKPEKLINHRGQPSSTQNTFSESDHRSQHFPEQNDRSLTVMIPRAKYHHSVLVQGSNGQAEVFDYSPFINESLLKIVSSDNCGSSSKESTFQCCNEKVSNKPHAKPSGGEAGAGIDPHSPKTNGALVSAGFEVSATVGNKVNYQAAQLLAVPGSKSTLSSERRDGSEPHFKFNKYKDSHKFIDSMDIWIDTLQQNELTSEARSLNETTIKLPTKSLPSVNGRQLSESNGNDEANTMTERDIGSTCLLPHTHLYKPDRDSDVSGFDSF